MRAVAIAGTRQLEVIEMDQPVAMENQVLIRIERAGICGSDLHMWENGKPPGLVMGHEIAGTIADAGASTGFNIGDRVTAITGKPCLECKFCQSRQYHACPSFLNKGLGLGVHGGYAEYLAVDSWMVRRLPSTMSMEEACMAEPSAVALRAVRLARIQPGERLLIVGSGVIGLLCAAWARIFGAGYIALSELNPERREKAGALGDVDQVFDASEPKLQRKLLGLTDGGFDKTLECAGPAPAVTSALGATKYDGTAVFVGINYNLVPISTLRVCSKEINIKGSYGYSIEEFDMSLHSIARGILNTRKFVEGTVDLEGVQDAFERLTDPNGSAIKIMIKP
ncbi:MAG: zinc-dependent alcohol dehydrogenase [Syntrophomonadales bacterium]